MARPKGGCRCVEEAARPSPPSFLPRFGRGEGRRQRHSQRGDAGAQEATRPLPSLPPSQIRWRGGASTAVWLEGEGGDGDAAHLPSPPSLFHPDPVVRATAVWPSLSLSLSQIRQRGGGMPEGGRRQWVGWWWVYFFPLIIFLQAGGCSSYENGEADDLL